MSTDACRPDTITTLPVVLDDGSLIRTASSVPNDADFEIADQAPRRAQDTHHSLVSGTARAGIWSRLDYSIAILAGSEPVC
jgi:hypothetical protein